LKNIVKVVSLLVISLVFMACGNRVPFKVQEPLDNAALVYIYVTTNLGTEEGDSHTDYSIRINNKPYLQRVVAGEHIALNVKPQPMTISATKRQIEEKVLNLDLKAGHIYYLKISDNLDGGRFDFEMVNNDQGLKEIKSTGVAGTSVESPENIITELITGSPATEENVMVTKQTAPAATAPVYAAPAQPVMKAKPSTKIEDIQNAYKLKEQGILSNEEFQKLKSEILSK
jgi:hypothetical protein